MAQTKEQVEKYYRLNLLWCSKCLKSLTPDTAWIPNDMNDNRIFCLDCAPGDAIRSKDTI